MLRRALHGLSETAQQGCASLQPDQRIVGSALKAVREPSGVDPLQTVGINAQRSGRIARKSSGREHVERSDGQSFGAADGAPGRRIMVRPVAAGARVEKHTDDREVIGGAALLEGVGEGGADGKLRPAIDAVDVKWRQRA